MKNIDQKWWWIIGGVALTGMGVGAFLIWKKKREGLASDQNLEARISYESNLSEPPIKQNTEGKNNAVIVKEPNWGNPFDMHYANDVKKWISPQRVRFLDRAIAQQYATILKKAKGGAWYKNDNEKAVYEVFAKKLKDKVQVANLSQVFWEKYNLDMWEYLASFLSKKELEKYVHRPVRILPKYRIS